MSELNQIGCEEFADVAAELALGVLTGRERAEALAHLDHCEGCRETVRQLTSTGEELLGLLPASEPPPGFESRVMERIGLTVPEAPGAPGARAPRAGHWRPRAWAGGLKPRRLIAAAAVVAAIVAGGAGGWSLRGPGSHAAVSAPVSAPLVSPSHYVVGSFVYQQGNPGRVYASVNLSSATETVICQVVGMDGHVTTIGSFQLADGSGWWNTTAPARVGQLAGAQLLSSRGTVLATASFSSH